MTHEASPRSRSLGSKIAFPLLAAGIPLAIGGFFGTSSLLRACVEARGQVDPAEVTRTAFLLGTLVLGGTGLVTILALLLLKRSVLEPAGEILGTLRSRSEGDRKARVPELESRELGEIASELNGMLDAQDSSRAEVESVNQELRDARDEAVRAARFRASFLANMSHEIRTPLMGMLGMVELLRESDLGEEPAEYVETIHRGAGTLLRIVNDILDLSRIEMGDLRLEDIAFDVRDLLEQSADLLRVEAGRKGVALSSRVGRGVPPTLKGDPTRIRQILTTLLSNAVKFTEAGTIDIGARLVSSRGDVVEVELTVRDSGMGMSSDVLEKLFLPYSQAEASTTRKYGGTGLGLSICKRLVERMGGDISATSEPGRGSTFRFTIPLGVPDLERVPAESSPEPEGVADADRAPGAPPASGAGRVLLAEDNAINRNVATQLLTKLGFEVETAVNGEAAVRAVAGKEFDAILMDCQMPDMDGYQATARIRELEDAEERIPIIAVTAHAMQSDREKCLDAGMDDYLAKPFTGADLKAVLLRWIGPEDPE